MLDRERRLRVRRRTSLGVGVLLLVVLTLGLCLVLVRSRLDDACRPPDRRLTSRAQVAQLLMVGVAEEGVARSLLGGSAPVGGILLLRSESSWYGDGRLKRLGERGQLAPLIAVDEEGGSVQRLASEAGRIPAARAVALAMTPEEAEELARSHALRLRRLGVNTVLAPVADLYDPANPTIGDRSFSADPLVVGRYSAATARGLRRAGLMPVMKHFPGGGRASADPHRAPATTPDIATLKRTDLIPFQTTSRFDAAVMVGHLDVPGLTDADRPASLSERAIGGLLRDELGFDGMVLTDDLSAMGAVTSRHSLQSAVILAIRAGADMMILSDVDQRRLDQVLDEVSRKVEDDPALGSAVTAALGRAARARTAFGICA